MHWAVHRAFFGYRHLRCYEVLLSLDGEPMWVPALGTGYRSAVLTAGARAGVPAPDDATVREADLDAPARVPKRSRPCGQRTGAYAPSPAPQPSVLGPKAAAEGRKCPTHGAGTYRRHFAANTDNRKSRIPSSKA